MRLKHDLTGRTFGNLTVISRDSERNNGVYWLCKCDCGKIKTFLSNNLRKGYSKSCGCAKNIKHGHNTTAHTTTEYNSWHQMKQRCLNKNDKRYSDYGGRGITICERWLDFNNFLADMGEKPSLDHSIDRIDVNGNYEPSNCRWANRSEQQRNIRVQRNNKLGVKGVSFDKEKGKYLAQLYFDGKRRLYKRFNTIEEAEQARKEAEQKYWKSSS